MLFLNHQSIVCITYRYKTNEPNLKCAYIGANTFSPALLRVIISGSLLLSVLLAKYCNVFPIVL